MATSDQDKANQEVSVFQRRKKSDSKYTQSDPRQREMSLWRVLQCFWQYQKNTDSNILTFKEGIYVYTSLKENFGGKSKRKKEREREKEKGIKGERKNWCPAWGRAWNSRLNEKQPKFCWETEDELAGVQPSKCQLFSGQITTTATCLVLAFFLYPDYCRRNCQVSSVLYCSKVVHFRRVLVRKEIWVQCG